MIILPNINEDGESRPIVNGRCRRGLLNVECWKSETGKVELTGRKGQLITICECHRHRQL